MKLCDKCDGAVTMIYDTDIIIFFLRGSHKAAQTLENDDNKHLSIQSYMELIQNPKDKQEQLTIRNFVYEADFAVIPFTNNISHRAAIYIEQFALSHGLRSADALIAATAAENNLALCSANKKHFQFLNDIEFIPFDPEA